MRWHYLLRCSNVGLQKSVDRTRVVLTNRYLSVATTSAGSCHATLSLHDCNCQISYLLRACDTPLYSPATRGPLGMGFDPNVALLRHTLTSGLAPEESRRGPFSSNSPSSSRHSALAPLMDPPARPPVARSERPNGPLPPSEPDGLHPHPRSRCRCKPPRSVPMSVAPVREH